MDGGALYRHLLVVDAERFGVRCYDGQRRLRDRLYRVMWSSLGAVGISREDARCEDRGDGGFWVLPVAVPKAVVTGPFVRRLNEELELHNERSERDVTGLRVVMRLRVALHAGEVGEDENGWVGPDLNTAFRLVNADPVRRALAEDEKAPLALIMSRHWYGAVRGHRIEGFDPAAVRRARVSSKEVDETAWLYVPGRASPRAGLDAPAAERKDLRKTLEAYRAMQNGSGLAGDAELSGLYLRARGLLRRNPCDLGKAAGAVEDYQRAIRRTRGYGGGERP